MGGFEEHKEISQGCWDSGFVKQALVLPTIGYNLIAGGKLIRDNNNISINITNQRCVIKYKDRPISYGIIKEDNLIYLTDDNLLTFNAHSNDIYAINKGNYGFHRPLNLRLHDDNLLWKWHLRLGHCAPETIKKMFQHQMAKGLKNDYNAIKDLTMPTCPICMQGKSTQLP